MTRWEQHKPGVWRRRSHCGRWMVQITRAKPWGRPGWLWDLNDLHRRRHREVAQGFTRSRARGWMLAMTIASLED